MILKVITLYIFFVIVSAIVFVKYKSKHSEIMTKAQEREREENFRCSWCGIVSMSKYLFNDKISLLLRERAKKINKHKQKKSISFSFINRNSYKDKSAPHRNHIEEKLNL